MLDIIDTSLIDTSLMVSQFITNAKEWDVMTLKLLVDVVHLLLILVTLFLTPFVGDFLEIVISLLNTNLASPWVGYKNSPSWEYSWI